MMNRCSGQDWRGRGLCLLSAWVVALAGCGSGPEFVNDPWTVPSAQEYRPSGEPVLELGFYVDGTYRKTGDGGNALIINGLQGGRWMMPVVRVKGLELRVRLRCEVETADGEIVGTAEEQTDLVIGSGGWIEYQGFPIPIIREDAENGAQVAELFGRSGTVACSVQDGTGRTAFRQHTVKLVDGGDG